MYQLKGGPIVAEPPHAVFLSYASQDTEAAQKICEALRAAGIEVFLDQSELRGGDVGMKRSGGRSTTARSSFPSFQRTRPHGTKVISVLSGILQISAPT